MAIAALSNFTVPLASDQSATSQGMLMPKLKYRFRVSFENFGISTPTTELTKQVMSAARPNVQFEDQVIPIYNSQIHYAGKPKWQTIQIKLRDDSTGAVSKLVGEQMQKQFDFYEQSSAASGQDYKFTLRIEMLDGGNGASTPNILETWVCYGCYVQQANYEAIDYGQQGPAEITLTLQMDNAVQTPSGSGVGNATSVRPGTPGTLATGGGQGPR
jgi:hypothetical protein